MKKSSVVFVAIILFVLGFFLVRRLNQDLKPEKANPQPTQELINRVDPIYPDEAKKARVEGQVIIEVLVGDDGHVKDTKVLRSIPLLDQAAIDAVKQWIYEPKIVDGKPLEFKAVITVSFLLNAENQKTGPVGGVIGRVVPLKDESAEPVRAIGDVKPPTLIKRVEPIYPETARQAKVEGVVILEAQTDIYGRVQSIKVLRSIPQLDQAAIDAVRQWVYEPMLIDGKPRSIIFTVTVRFKLE